jgi:GDP-4-dehydro-6-deoxy-D-mannose reductase
VAVSRRGTAPPDAGTAAAVDLLDADALSSAVAAARPDIVFHLAALSSVRRSWEQPRDTLSANVTMSVNLLEALRHEAPSARIVWVSTCEVYGVPEALPIPESASIRPANPYAVSKAAAEMLAGVYARSYGLDLVCARPFSHAGPGQLPIFLLSSLARQAAQGRRDGVQRLRIVTGNPDTRRDFTDVRDIVAAYRELAAPRAGDVYNVSSGRSISAAEQVTLLSELISPIEVEHVVDPARVRAHEVMELRGDSSRLSEETGWRPAIPLRQTMADTIDWWDKRLANGIGV